MKTEVIVFAEFNSPAGWTYLPEYIDNLDLGATSWPWTNTRVLFISPTEKTVLKRARGYLIELDGRMRFVIPRERWVRWWKTSGPKLLKK